VALTSGDPTVAAPGYLYSGGEQVKPTNPPATFDELQERMEALDELANMTDQESSYMHGVSKIYCTRADPGCRRLSGAPEHG